MSEMRNEFVVICHQFIVESIKIKTSLREDIHKKMMKLYSIKPFNYYRNIVTINRCFCVNIEFVWSENFLMKFYWDYCWIICWQKFDERYRESKLLLGLLAVIDPYRTGDEKRYFGSTDLFSTDPLPMDENYSLREDSKNFVTLGNAET